MKGAIEVLSVIIMTGILIALVGTVYFWGLPLIQTHEDISTLRNAEIFMISLEDKIKDVVNLGGSDRIELTVPHSILVYDGNKISLKIETKGTSYTEGAVIPLGINNCTMTEGIWGIHSFSVVCVTSECEGGTGKDCQKYLTTYELRYIKLNTETGLKSHKIEFIPTWKTLYGGEKNSIIIENKGYTEKNVDGRDLISAMIEINII